MQNYLQPEADGLRMGDSGRWVAVKLDYLRRYLNAFTTAMRDHWPAMHYIDLFSGSGKCRDRNTENVHLGSPLIAITATHPFTHYCFVDKDAKYIAALRERCRASPVGHRVECIAADANQAAHTVVDRIRALQPRGGGSLNLAFLDPAGLQLHWDTVTVLSRIRRVDLIIYYPHLGLNLNMKKAVSSPGETAVDRFFGSAEWRSIYEDWERKGRPKGLHRSLIDLYKRKLMLLGYSEVLRGSDLRDEPLIRSSRTRAPLYYLLFASKHPLGHQFWRSVIRKDVHGQMRMLLDGTGTYVL
ncbi:MAG TPA: three-Cys-motif partner protein TcmP [Anaerolineae bacterium]|nr:three-Cys-motif partner protein TcmP [Anaerolineae bacterium]